MPNEETTPQVEAYNPPLDAENLSPDEAASALNVILAEAAADKLHPYQNKNHIQHRVYADGVKKLFEKKAEGGDGLSPITRACNEALAGLEVRKDKLRTEAEAELAACEKLGFARGDVPADLKNFDLKEYNVAVWKMQRLAAEEKYSELTPLFEKQLRELRAPSDTVAALSAFNQAESLDPALRGKIVEEIIGWIYEANKKKFGGK